MNVVFYYFDKSGARLIIISYCDVRATREGSVGAGLLRTGDVAQTRLHLLLAVDACTTVGCLPSVVVFQLKNNNGRNCLQHPSAPPGC